MLQIKRDNRRMKLLPQRTLHWALSKSCSLKPADRKGQNHREWSVENPSLLAARRQVLKLRKRVAVRQSKRTPGSSGKCTAEPGVEVVQDSKEGEEPERSSAPEMAQLPIRGRKGAGQSVYSLGGHQDKDTKTFLETTRNTSWNCVECGGNKSKQWGF